MRRFACVLAVTVAALAGCGSSPSGAPGVYNNDDHPVKLTLAVNGEPLTVQPLKTVRTAGDAVWTVPKLTYCTWHYGFGGGNPNYAGQGARIVISHEVTIEGCASSAATTP